MPSSSQQPNVFLNTVLNPPSNANSTSYANSGTFTPTQRSLQARNKGYNNEVVVGGGGGGGGGGGERDTESYTNRQKREEAGRIIERMEMLIWWSAALNMSIPATRAHFQNIVLGFGANEHDVVWKEEWEVNGGAQDGTMASPRSAKGKEKDRGKRRVSDGV